MLNSEVIGIVPYTYIILNNDVDVHFIGSGTTIVKDVTLLLVV